MTEADRPSTVLVVDDEPQLLRLLTRIFERAQLDVLSARDGESAISVFEEHHAEIQAVFLDVILPPNGVRPVLDHMLGMRDDLAVVLCSGDDLEPSLRDRLEASGGIFLRKPFRPEAALEAIQKAGGASAGNAS